MGGSCSHSLIDFHVIYALTQTKASISSYATLPSDKELVLTELRQQYDVAAPLEVARLSLEELHHVLTVVRCPEFWRQNHAIHPHTKRMKAWLWMHEHFREQSTCLTKCLEQDLDAVNWKQVAKSFARLVHGISKHSKFEDNQLFPYFQQHLASQGQIFEQLTREHASTEHIADIQRLLAQVQTHQPVGLELQHKIRSFHQDLLQHMHDEELVLIIPWLNLTRGQYQDFRRQLSFPYSWVY